MPFSTPKASTEMLEGPVTEPNEYLSGYAIPSFLGALNVAYIALPWTFCGKLDGHSTAKTPCFIGMLL